MYTIPQVFGLLDAARANVRVQLSDQAKIMRAAEHMRGEDFRDFVKQLSVIPQVHDATGPKKTINEAQAKHLNAFLKHIPSMNKSGRRPGAR